MKWTGTGMKPNASNAKKTEIWGLTGGIASGKSTVARIFEQAGIPVVDADEIARAMSQPGGRAHDAIVREFGTADRHKLRQIVFADPERREKLEAILHPLIQQESLARFAEKIAQAKTPPPFLVYEASLLIETGRARDFAGLIVVDAPREIRRQRLIDRDGIDGALADRILDAQAARLSDEARRKQARFLIVNDRVEARETDAAKKLAEPVHRVIAEIKARQV